jgi:hypothetical protein
LPSGGELLRWAVLWTLFRAVLCALLHAVLCAVLRAVLWVRLLPPVALPSLLPPAVLPGGDLRPSGDLRPGDERLRVWLRGSLWLWGGDACSGV